MVKVENKTKFTFKVQNPFIDMGETIYVSEVVADNLEDAYKILLNTYEGMLKTDFNLVKEESVELYNPAKRVSMEVLDEYENYRYISLGNFYDDGFLKKGTVK